MQSAAAAGDGERKCKYLGDQPRTERQRLLETWNLQATGGSSQKCRLAGDFQQLPGRRRWQDVIFYSKHTDGLLSCVGRAHMPHCIENYCSPQLP